jgi:hypothetical protein
MHLVQRSIFQGKGLNGGPSLPRARTMATGEPSSIYAVDRDQTQNTGPHEGPQMGELRNVSCQHKKFICNDQVAAGCTDVAQKQAIRWPEIKAVDPATAGVLENQSGFPRKTFSRRDITAAQELLLPPAA